MKSKNHIIFSSSSSPELISNDKDYDSFTKLINRKMGNYCLDKDSSQTDFDKTKKLLLYSKIKIRRDEKDFINRVTRNKIDIKKYVTNYNNTNNSKFNSTDNIFNSSIKSTMSINIPRETFYFSPLHSLSVLKLNSIIHSDIIQTNLHRQKSLYNDSINVNKELKSRIFTKMPKIKVSRIIPKFTNIPIINRINNLNDKNEDDKNLEKDKIKENNEAEKENNQSKEKQIRKSKNLNKNIKFFNPPDYSRLFCYYKNPIINFPESREQFSLVLKGNLLFVIGGLCCDCSLGELWICNLINISWSKITSPLDTLLKFGHTAVLDKFDNKIFVYGGRAKYDLHVSYGKNKYIFCGLDCFDLKLNKWIKPDIINKNYIPQRRNHISELVGNQLVIQGGVDEDDNILNDSYYINLSMFETSKGRWHELSISSNTPGPYLYGHASSFVFQKDLLKDNKLSVYQFPEDINEEKVDKSNNKKRNKIKGIYVFGGKSKYNGIGGLSNDIYVLILGKKPCIWIRLDNVKGIKPKPRYFHSMSYYEPGNFLIIHGGRNDYQNESYALDDTFIFNLNLFQWQKINLYSNMIGFKVFPRCGHKSIIYSNKLLIFGGMNNVNYLGSSFFIIDLSEDYSPVFKTAEEIMLENLTYKQDLNDQGGNDKNKVIQELKDKINQNHKLGFVENVSLPWIK